MMKDTTDSKKWENMQFDDHTTLIRLEAKVDSLILDVKEVKDGTTIKLADHETRIRTIEKTHEEINPIQVTKDFKDVQQQVHDFQTIWKFAITVAGTIGGIIGFILSVAVDSLHLFGR